MTDKTEAPEILDVVGELLAKADALLSESYPQTEAENEAQDEIRGRISGVARMLEAEQKRRIHGEGICTVPGCKRPVDERDGIRWCTEHREHFDAVSEVEQREFTLEILTYWTESARAIGHPELTQVMEGAFGQVDEHLAQARSRLERTQAALSATEEAEDA